jgi:hypothetical protein
LSRRRPKGERGGFRRPSEEEETQQGGNDGKIARAPAADRRATTSWHAVLARPPRGRMPSRPRRRETLAGISKRSDTKSLAKKARRLDRTSLCGKWHFQQSRLMRWQIVARRGGQRAQMAIHGQDTTDKAHGRTKPNHASWPAWPARRRTTWSSAVRPMISPKGGSRRRTARPRAWFDQKSQRQQTRLQHGRRR